MLGYKTHVLLIPHSQWFSNLSRCCRGDVAGRQRRYKPAINAFTVEKLSRDSPGIDFKYPFTLQRVIFMTSVTKYLHFFVFLCFSSSFLFFSIISYVFLCFPLLPFYFLSFLMYFRVLSFFHSLFWKFLCISLFFIPVL